VRPRAGVVALIALALLVAVGSAVLLARDARSGGAGPEAAAAGPPAPLPPYDAQMVAHGRELFDTGCASCHGPEGRGIADRGPALEEAGASAADWYLRTGRMPLAVTGEQPVRAEPAYDEAEIQALVAYVGSLGGPPIPEVDPARGDVSEGQRLFTASCAGCHAITARGGIVTGARVPALDEVTPRQVHQTIRLGPWVMPEWGPEAITDEQVASIAAYVELTQSPPGDGGWGIGFIGPVPEGLAAWLLAIAALVVVARLIGRLAR
jgi:ubiquinol-cytochrome c reductase cytochrome c subunit